MNNHLITLMIVLPLVGALLQAFVPKIKGIPADSVGRWAALIASVAASICAFVLVISMQRQTPELQAAETLPWIGSYSITYEMGIDGLNALMVLLVGIVFPILIAAEWRQKVGARGMFALFLVLQAAFFGVICAQDMFLQFFFWGLTSLPFYFLIGIWGGPKRETAAFRSIVAAAIGNALLFAAMLLIYYSAEPHSFSLHELAGGKLAGKVIEFGKFEVSVPIMAFVLISGGLALRAAIWPFHGWFTRIAEEAPASVFVALCSVSIPVATYMFVRLCYTLFPEIMMHSAQIIVIVGGVNLLIGGICAASQKDLRLLLAFICISEVGLVMVGIGSLHPAGVVGAVYQQLVLGLGLAGFGLFSGLLTDRAGHAVFMAGADGHAERPFGGIALAAPTVAVVAGIFVASILGFPGFGGFVGHALLLIGSFPAHPATAVLAACAILLATYYLFVMYRAVFLGEAGAGSRSFSDLTIWERAYLIPLVSGILFCGVYPKPLLEIVRPTVLTLLSTVK